MSLKIFRTVAVIIFFLVTPPCIIFKCYCQTHNYQVQIARDSFGVPHIYGKTDADAAYGLAWAHCEDDFTGVQQALLSGKNMLGRVTGKEGVIFDFGLQFLGIDELVETKYESALSEDFKKVVEAYIDGVNDYAKKYPDEILCKKAFPFTPKDLIKGSVLTTSLFAGVGMALRAIREGRIEDFSSLNDFGSNSIAVSPIRTEDSKAWLVINSHQPLEGRFSWYEAHIKSDEGWNITGGLFPGGTTIFLGVNEYLGWAHTTNYHNFGDIYRLSVKKGKYLYDGSYKKLIRCKARLNLKFGGLILPVSKKFYRCEYGPVLKTSKGYYAIRFPSYEDIRVPEQWYRMNKAKNLAEFEAALRYEAVPLFNVMYADVKGNIYYHSSGRIPLRNPALNWKNPIEGTSSVYKWTSLVPFEHKPHILNPSCGYIQNCNQTPLHVTGDSCEWKGNFVGLQRFNYNRGERMKEMFDSIEGPISWKDLLRIKYDKRYSFHGAYQRNFYHLYHLDPSKYPDIADAIEIIKKWNLEATPDNRQASLILVIHDLLVKKFRCPFAYLMVQRQPLSEEACVEIVRLAKKFLLKTHGRLDIPMGEMFRHQRGDKSYPASGMREVCRAADPKLIDKKRGIYKSVNGDGLTILAKFGLDGKVEIQSVNAFGNSARPESRHYTDQMELFVKEQFKTATLDMDEIFKKALRIYRPGE
ncbi:MAG: penicillin acylase family protein [Chitinophagales bacterium]|nr:penicillin acylase family protein [Chitinophagales bacterium]MDW8273150.1 penicillin acylase family protein [Chitinophagales bacterium]